MSRMYATAIHRRAFATILVLLFSFSSFAEARATFSVALPNGYLIERDRAGEPRIVKRKGGVVVPGPVAAYAVYGFVVVGVIGEWAPRPGGYPNASPYVGTPESKYFILDTATGEIEKDLDEATWKKRLDESGVAKAPVITAPVLPE